MGAPFEVCEAFVDQQPVGFDDRLYERRSAGVMVTENWRYTAAPSSER